MRKTHKSKFKTQNSKFFTAFGLHYPTGVTAANSLGFSHFYHVGCMDYDKELSANI